MITYVDKVISALTSYLHPSVPLYPVSVSGGARDVCNAWYSVYTHNKMIHNVHTMIMFTRLLQQMWYISNKVQTCSGVGGKLDAQAADTDVLHCTQHQTC